MSSTHPPKAAVSGDLTKPLGSTNSVNKTHVRISSEALFQGALILEVVHNGQVYRLQKTALNKLILTK